MSRLKSSLHWRAGVCCWFALAWQVAGPIGAQSPSLSPGKGDNSIAPTHVEVEQAILLASAYLRSACGPNGRFDYEVNMATGGHSDAYNVIRHAGAMYALEMQNGSKTDLRTDAVLLRAAIYLKKNYFVRGPSPDMLMVQQDPLPAESYVNLGANGLAIVALAPVYRGHPAEVSLQELQALGRFILFLQRKNGSFISRYSPQQGQPAAFSSLYYPGEATLGLLTLYELDGSVEWLNAAISALRFLAQSRASLLRVPADSWSLIASAKLFELCERSKCKIPKEALINDARKMCDSILAEQVNDPLNLSVDGGFSPVGYTTHGATRVEGLLAAAQFLPDDELKKRVRIAADKGIVFLLRSQISSGPYAGGIPGSTSATIPDASKIRIDYVQHALSALILYRRLSW